MQKLTQTGGDWNGLVNTYIGLVQVNGNPLRMTAPQLNYSSLDSDAQIRIATDQARYDVYANVSVAPPLTAQERLGDFIISVSLNAAQASFEGATPDSMDAHSAHFLLHSLKDGWLEGAKVAETNRTKDGQPSSPALKLFVLASNEAPAPKTFEQQKPPPQIKWNFDVLWEQVALFVPYIPAVVLLRRYATGIHLLARYARVLWPLLYIQAICAVTAVLEQAPFVPWIASILNNHRAWPDLFHAEGSSGLGTAAFTLASLGVLVPIIFPQKLTAKTAQIDGVRHNFPFWFYRTLRAGFVLLVISAIVVLALLVLLERGAFSTFDAIVLSVVITVPLMLGVRNLASAGCATCRASQEADRGAHVSLIKRCTLRDPGEEFNGWRHLVDSRIGR